MPGGQDPDDDGPDALVVVPGAPGPLLRPAAGGGGRNRDGLDDLIDELLPDTPEGPGAVDATLIAGGGALVGWSALGHPPAAATVVGVVALGLGCMLPLRAGWRRISAWRSARRRGALLARGVPLRVDDPALGRLVAGYEALDAGPATTSEARAAAHGAVLEVASLLSGRSLASDRERSYVEDRAMAIEELVRALDDSGPAEPSAVDLDLVIEAREELDFLGGTSALARLGDVTAEVRARGRPR